jgi:bifunctional non-homologous end joining protein LigD
MALQRRRSESSDPPRFISPQQTKLVDAPSVGDAWLREIKLDGYLMHARIAGKQARLLTRAGLDWTMKMRRSRH